MGFVAIKILWINCWRCRCEDEARKDVGVMPFKFALAAVLRVRESLERQEERVLQAIQVEVLRLEQQAASLRDLIARARCTREEMLRESVTGGQLHSTLMEEQAAERELERTLTALQSMELQREEQRKIYLVAHRERETLSEMFETQKSVYEQGRAREEQKRLDDLFAARRLRA